MINAYMSHLCSPVSSDLSSNELADMRLCPSLNLAIGCGGVWSITTPSDVTASLIWPAASIPYTVVYKRMPAIKNKIMPVSYLTYIYLCHLKIKFYLIYNKHIIGEMLMSYSF